MGRLRLTGPQRAPYPPHVRHEAVFTGVTQGQIVFADGSTAMLKVNFMLLEGPDGPRLFFAKAACGGG